MNSPLAKVVGAEAPERIEALRRAAYVEHGVVCIYLSELPEALREPVKAAVEAMLGEGADD